MFPIFHARSRLEITILSACLYSKLPFDLAVRTCWVSFVVYLNNRARDGYCFRTVGDREVTRGLSTSDVNVLILDFRFRVSFRKLLIITNLTLNLPNDKKLQWQENSSMKKSFEISLCFHLFPV